MVSIDQLKQLREQTGISMMECKKALEEDADWEVFEKALLEILPGREKLEVFEIMTAFYEGCVWRGVCRAWYSKERANAEVG